MKIAVFYEDNNFGSNFYSSLYDGLGEGTTRPQIDTHEIKSEDKLMEIVNAWTAKPDVIIGPNTTAYLSRLLTSGKVSDVPVISTQATSGTLNHHKNYYELAVPDSKRVKLLMERISFLYGGGSDVYVFTRKDDTDSYSSNLGKHVVAEFKKNKNFNRHILLDYEFDFSFQKVEDKIQMMPQLTLPQDLQVNPKYPIVVCAESLQAVYLVKHLRDQGHTNSIFVFGTNRNFAKRFMRRAFLVADEDDKIDFTDEQVEYRVNLTSLTLGKHIAAHYGESFKLDEFKKFMDSWEPAIAVKRIKNNYETKTVDKGDMRLTKIYLFVRRLLELEKITMLLLTLAALIVALVALWKSS